MVPMPELTMTADRKTETYWVSEALRSWAEGDFGSGDLFLSYALIALEAKTKSNFKVQ